MSCWSVALVSAHPETIYGPLCALLVLTSGFLQVGLLQSLSLSLPFLWIQGKLGSSASSNTFGRSSAAEPHSPPTPVVAFWAPLFPCNWSCGECRQACRPLKCYTGQARCSSPGSGTCKPFWIVPPLSVSSPQLQPWNKPPVGSGRSHRSIKS